MTASMPTTQTAYSRCLRVVDDETNRRCGHPATRSVESSDLIPELDMMRHTICFEDDRGHCWSTSWSTDVILT